MQASIRQAYANEEQAAHEGAFLWGDNRAFDTSREDRENNNTSKKDREMVRRMITEKSGRTKERVGSR